jgi:hypothetical protein
VAAPKRTFAAPIAIVTIDQALLSIVRSRHAWMRAAFLSRHLLIVDEVHASDPYMAALIRGLIDRHISLGGRALAMSATLGETALAILLNRERSSIEQAIAAPYPVFARCSAWNTYRSCGRPISSVQDNLPTHTRGALYQAFPPAEARRISRRLEFHYTPKHASWLNMVEIEIGVLRSQCLDRRIESQEQLKSEIAAWERQRNASGARINAERKLRLRLA